MPDDAYGCRAVILTQVPLPHPTPCQPDSRWRQKLLMPEVHTTGLVGRPSLVYMHVIASGWQCLKWKENAACIACRTLRKHTALPARPDLTSRCRWPVLTALARCMCVRMYGWSYQVELHVSAVSAVSYTLVQLVSGMLGAMLVKIDHATNLV